MEKTAHEMLREIIDLHGWTNTLRALCRLSENRRKTMPYGPRMLAASESTSYIASAVEGSELIDTIERKEEASTT